MIATPNNSSRDDLQPTIISSNSYVSAAALLPLPKAPPQKSPTSIWENENLDKDSRKNCIGREGKRKTTQKTKNALPQNL